MTHNPPTGEEPLRVRDWCLASGRRRWWELRLQIDPRAWVIGFIVRRAGFGWDLRLAFPCGSLYLSLQTAVPLRTWPF